ncbi:hypothetical protein GGR57DRAFT_341372 [Xylariaceae sp. FL1272]|nr:hypothetical protein GGR57DRAFT_341372 [Xylariaceae sp. FL1272]
MYRPHITALSTIATIILEIAAGSLNNEDDIHKDFATMLYLRQDALQATPVDTNLNIFEGDLGVGPLAITPSGDVANPFAVAGQNVASFNDAINKACDGQQNLCQREANEGQKGQFVVGDCDEQSKRCHSELEAATQTKIMTLATETSTPDFDFICES